MLELDPLRNTTLLAALAVLEGRLGMTDALVLLQLLALGMTDALVLLQLLARGDITLVGGETT